ncbi:MAG: uracil-DNA glycosylase [Vampirovibrionales bacterium]|nr:uracil-DNA glycosylase [Vampirovibrionales bacterium]
MQPFCAERPLPKTQPKFAPGSLAELEAAAKACQRCSLGQTRIQAVVSDGSPLAKIMLIGEAPGQQEDESGLPFIGRSGQLLTRLLANAGLNRATDIYICNMVKCRPPENRKPYPAELAACADYLQAQIALVKPQIFILAGSTALKGLLKLNTPISKIRGQWLAAPYPGVPHARAMAIFHPSYLLRYGAMAPGSPKWQTLEDLKIVQQALTGL